MDIHHDSSLKCILEDDSISSASKAQICSYLSKGARLWLVVTPFIHLFYIAHYIFTLVLRFRFNLIQLLAFSLFTCECGHGLDSFDIHLTCCLFESQG
jgi:hypothetical protein